MRLVAGLKKCYNCDFYAKICSRLPHCHNELKFRSKSTPIGRWKKCTKSKTNSLLSGRNNHAKFVRNNISAFPSVRNTKQSRRAALLRQARSPHRFAGRTRTSCVHVCPTQISSFDFKRARGAGNQSHRHLKLSIVVWARKVIATIKLASFLLLLPPDCAPFNLEIKCKRLVVDGSHKTPKSLLIQILWTRNTSWAQPGIIPFRYCFRNPPFRRHSDFNAGLIRTRVATLRKTQCPHTMDDRHREHVRNCTRCSHINFRFDPTIRLRMNCFPAHRMNIITTATAVQERRGQSKTHNNNQWE